MERIELAQLILDLADDITNDYPIQAQILLAVGSLTAFFEDEALYSLANMPEFMTTAALRSCK